VADETAPHAAPDDPLFFLRIAIARLGEGQSRAALEAPGLPQAHYAYGQAWLALNQPVRAGQAFAASLRQALQSARGEFRGLLVRSGNVTIQNLTIADAAAIGGDGGAGLASDGGGAGRSREAWRSA
jgi:hypothetical protein